MGCRSVLCSLQRARSLQMSTTAAAEELQPSAEQQPGGFCAFAQFCQSVAVLRWSHCFLLMRIVMWLRSLLMRLDLLAYLIPSPFGMQIHWKAF